MSSDRLTGMFVVLIAVLCACGGKTNEDVSPPADSAIDAVDVALDTGSPPADSTPDGLAPVAPPGHVACGAAGVCDLATQICCRKSDGDETGTPSCVTGTKCPGAYDAIVACEKSSDCKTAGEICCASVGLNGNLHAECMTDCGTGAAQRCAMDAECRGGLGCKVHECAGGNVLRVCGHPAVWCS